MSINSFRQFRQDVRIAPRKGLYTKRIAWQSFLAGLTTIATIALFIGHISTVQAQADPRAQMIARAQSWINAHVPYNQGGSYDGYREDCSGFVSYVWLLGSSPDTVGLWEHYSTVLPSINSLLPGDTLNNNTPGNFGHVLIFAQWDNPSHSQFTSYEEVGNHGAISRHLSILEDGTIPGLNAHQPFYPERLNSLFTPGQPTFSSDAHSSLNISMASYQVCASNLGTGTTVYIVMWRDAVPSRGIATPGGWSYSGQSQNGCYNITALTSPGLPLANVVYYSVAALVPINISEAAQKRTACAAATGFARMCDSSSAAGIIPPLQPTVFASDALSTLDIANATYRVCASNLGTGTTVYLVLWRDSIPAQGLPSHGWSYSGQSVGNCLTINSLTAPGLPLENVIYYSVSALVPIDISEASQKRSACANTTGFARMCDVGSDIVLTPTTFLDDALSTLNMSNKTYQVCAANLESTVTVYLVLWRAPAYGNPAQGWSYQQQASNGCANFSNLAAPEMPFTVTYYSVSALLPLNISEAAQQRTSCALETNFARMCDASLGTNTPTATPPPPTATSLPPTSTPVPLRMDTIGIYRAGTFYMRNQNTTGFANIIVAYNPATQPYPVVGDWTGGGIDTVGVYDQSNGQFMLRNSNTPGTPDETFGLGIANDQPLSGRWQASAAHSGVGVFRPSNGLIYLKNDLSTGYADYTMVLGIPGDVGVAGDWNSKGYDSPGAYRPSTTKFYLSNQVTNGGVFGDYEVQLGIPGDVPIVGDWIGQGHDGVGVFRVSNGLIYMKDALTTGYADRDMVYGIANDIPVAGHWVNNAAVSIATAANLIVPNTPSASTATPTAAQPFIRITGQPSYDG